MLTIDELLGYQILGYQKRVQGVGVFSLFPLKVIKGRLSPRS